MPYMVSTGHFNHMEAKNVLESFTELEVLRVYNCNPVICFTECKINVTNSSNNGFRQEQLCIGLHC